MATPDFDEHEALKQVASGVPVEDIVKLLGWPAMSRPMLVKRLRRAASRELHPSNPHGDRLVAGAALGRLHG